MIIKKTTNTIKNQNFCRKIQEKSDAAFKTFLSKNFIYDWLSEYNGSHQY